MAWNKSLEWLLEDDTANPGVRYFALRDLAGAQADDPELQAAQRDVMEHGPVPVILSKQQPEGYWSTPGPGYSPKYRSTVWQIAFLAQLGADGGDERVRTACDYLLDNTSSPYGGLSMNGRSSGLIHCLQGNLVAALIDLGRLEDQRLATALDWLARSVTGEGIAPASKKKAEVRYYRSGNSAPGFACSANDHLPCAWGAVKAMLALSKVPTEMRTASINAAIDSGVDFLLGVDPATAAYPMGYAEKPNRSWFKFGFPVFYITDVLQNAEVLATLGYARDPRLENTVDLIAGKQDENGRWLMEYTYNGKTWTRIEEKGQPSKWVTLRAARVLRQAEV